MRTILIMVRNVATTLSGLIAGMAIYISDQGLALPTDSAGWKKILVSAAVASIGFTAKSATVGSKPNENPKFLDFGPGK